MSTPAGPDAYATLIGLVLGHQGGWDEVALVVGPLAIVGGLLWVANRRVAAQLGQDGDQQRRDGGDGDEPGRGREQRGRSTP